MAAWLRFTGGDHPGLVINLDQVSYIDPNAEEVNMGGGPTIKMVRIVVNGAGTGTITFNFHNDIDRIQEYLEELFFRDHNPNFTYVLNLPVKPTIPRPPMRAR